MTIKEIWQIMENRIKPVRKEGSVSMRTMWFVVLLVLLLLLITLFYAMSSDLIKEIISG